MSSACGETAIWTPYLLYNNRDWYHYTTEPNFLTTSKIPLPTFPRLTQLSGLVSGGALGWVLLSDILSVRERLSLRSEENVSQLEEAEEEGTPRLVQGRAGRVMLREGDLEEI